MIRRILLNLTLLTLLAAFSPVPPCLADTVETLPSSALEGETGPYLVMTRLKPVREDLFGLDALNTRFIEQVKWLSLLKALFPPVNQPMALPVPHAPK